VRTLSKALIPVLMLVALCVAAHAQSGLSIPGDLAVTDDITVGDDLDVDGDSNVDGTSTMNKHSSSYLSQRYLLEFDESWATGKAYADTFKGMPARTFWHAATDGMVMDVYFAVETVGADWDSLTVNLLAGTSADSSMLTTLPQITPAVGDKSNTLTEGRQAVMSSTMRNVDAGEYIRIWGRVYGTKSNPPTGLRVWVVFQPDYGN
jgi:hypothetical protein